MIGDEFEPLPDHDPADGLEDDGLDHEAEVDAFIERNKDALNAMIDRARAAVAAGRVSTRTIDEIFADARARALRR